jgi:hypothetical protein
MTRLTLRYPVSAAASDPATGIRPLTGGGPVQFEVNGVAFPAELISAELAEEGMAVMVTLDIDDGTNPPVPPARPACRYCGEPLAAGEWHTCVEIEPTTAMLVDDAGRVFGRHLAANWHGAWRFSEEVTPPNIEAADDYVVVVQVRTGIERVSDGRHATLVGTAVYEKFYDGHGSTKRVAKMRLKNVTCAIKSPGP